jgi:hypothetical protein
LTPVNNGFARRFHTKPLSLARPSRGDAGDYPFPFHDLLVDRDLEVRVRLPNADDMRFGAFNTYGESFAVMNFAIIGGHKTLNQINIPRIHDFLVV